MTERIIENEERLNNISKSIRIINSDLDLLESITKEIKLLNKYYGSKKWFDDKEKYESGNIKNIKAGVLSEDSVWNLDEDIKDLSIRLGEISEKLVKSITQF